jgi:hypothetical protein
MTEKHYYFPKLHYSDRSPTPTDDITKGFLPGGMFINNSSTPPVRYLCADNTTNAAIWFQIPDYINPSGGTSLDPQASIDSANLGKNILMTPHIMFQDNVINYDISINRNAMSVGPITIDEGYTVTIETSGTWTVI